MQEQLVNLEYTTEQAMQEAESWGIYNENQLELIRFVLDRIKSNGVIIPDPEGPDGSR